MSESEIAEARRLAADLAVHSTATTASRIFRTTKWLGVLAVVRARVV